MAGGAETLRGRDPFALPTALSDDKGVAGARLPSAAWRNCNGHDIRVSLRLSAGGYAVIGPVAQAALGDGFAESRPRLRPDRPSR